ncbi:3'-5' exoribonuclease [Actinomyces sp. zg-332]|uniref:exonuclease domain-containing protein n=1 Tax=Actinomyces sp. zg-332 TaxID=2708340 RepID=UPI00141DB9E8|nr:exonuclease domain-containing protein [Actinomyces sp. zg-332]QPK94672.1 3'-5' exoribonuclease [Actinomyces sp. zg-332]
MYDYIALDIENPNRRGNSICSIGIIMVKNGQVVDKIYSLINPEDRFDRKNIEITGISDEMVISAPNLVEYWKEIGHLLEEYIIVGHNIQYDLNVISKSLDRYNLPIPSFKYVCTYSTSKFLLSEQSYALGYLCNNIGYIYNQHNALEDAQASVHLFQYLLSSNPDFVAVPSEFVYKQKLQEKLDENLLRNINDLHGIIKGMAFDKVICDKEIEYLRAWVEENTKYKIYSVFHRILSTLEEVLQDGVITSYEYQLLVNLVGCVRSSNIYSDTTLGIQILKGILKAIISDDYIAEEEIVELKNWLYEHEYLSDVYPYDKVYSLVTQVLEDGEVSEDEKKQLFSSFEKILNPISTSGTISLQGKTFCLTGDFLNGSKREIESILTEKGGVKKSGVSAKLDYLFVGALGSGAWKYGNAGGKILKAQELQEKGKAIQIISESDLSSLFEKR